MPPKKVKSAEAMETKAAAKAAAAQLRADKKAQAKAAAKAAANQKAIAKAKVWAFLHPPVTDTNNTTASSALPLTPASSSQTEAVVLAPRPRAQAQKKTCEPIDYTNLKGVLEQWQTIEVGSNTLDWQQEIQRVKTHQLFMEFAETLLAPTTASNRNKSAESAAFGSSDLCPSDEVHGFVLWLVTNKPASEHPHMKPMRENEVQPQAALCDLQVDDTQG